MGSSLNLKGGTSTPKSIVETISQVNTFAAGDVVRYDLASATWVKAQADSAENSEVAGVVSFSTSSSFDITYSGYISISSLSASTSPVLFLDSSAAGGLTASPPSAIGTVVKPVLTKTSTGTGYLVTNYLGTQIGGSSTVAIDEIQPVGTIMPFAGSVIPDSWLECNGASYAVGAYPNLYAKLQNSSGDRVPAYGYVATLTGPGMSSFSVNVGDMVQFKTTAGTFAGTVNTTSALYESGADAIGLITHVTGSATATGVGTITVQIIPNYNSTTKKFYFPTAVFTAGVGIPTTTGSGNYRVLTTPISISSPSNGVLRANSNLTVSTVAITHLNTPDLRGRFPIGTNATVIGEVDGDLSGDTNYSTISGGYSMGSQGGQEFVVATPVTINNGTGTGINVINNIGASSNIANMPPYTVVRYIIKASPYTRAAIIDGIDIPYTSLLVSDLRDGSLRPGGSGEALVFKTNDGTSGVERMRLTNTPSAAAPGGLVIGDTSHTSGGAGPFTTAYRLLEVATTSGAGGGVFVARSPSTILEMGANEGLGSALVGTRTNHPLVFRTNTIEQMRIDANGQANIRSTVNSTSTTTGGLTLGGGLGMASNLTVGGGISAVGGISTAGGITASRLNVSTAGIFTRATGTGLDTNGNITMNGGGVFSITSSGNNNVMTMEGSGFEATMRFKDFWTGNSYQGKGPQIGSDANRFIIRTFDTTRVTITSAGVGISNVWIPSVAGFNWTRVGPQNNTTQGFAPLSNGVRAPLVNSADGIANQQYSMLVYFTQYSYFPGDGVIIKRFDNIPANALLVFSNDGLDLYSVNGVVQLDSSGAAKPTGNNGWHSQGSIVFYRTT